MSAGLWGCAAGSGLVLQTGFEGSTPYISTIAGGTRKFAWLVANQHHPERYRASAPISVVGSGERVRLISVREPEIPATAGGSTLDDYRWRVGPSFAS
jgi:hypothetical protein